MVRAQSPQGALEAPAHRARERQAHLGRDHQLVPMARADQPADAFIDGRGERVGEKGVDAVIVERALAVVRGQLQTALAGRTDAERGESERRHLQPRPAKGPQAKTWSGHGELLWERFRRRVQPAIRHRPRAPTQGQDSGRRARRKGADARRSPRRDCPGRGSTYDRPAGVRRRGGRDRPKDGENQPPSGVQGATRLRAAHSPAGMIMFGNTESPVRSTGSWSSRL